MGCGCSARRKPSAGTVIGYLVTYPDGAKAAIASGEVSVRGMYGYV